MGHSDDDIHCTGNLYRSKVAVVTLINLREVKKILGINFCEKIHRLYYTTVGSFKVQQPERVVVLYSSNWVSLHHRIVYPPPPPQFIHIDRIFDKTFVRFKLLCYVHRSAVSAPKSEDEHCGVPLSTLNRAPK